MRPIVEYDSPYRPPAELCQTASGNPDRASNWYFEAAGYPGFVALPFAGAFIGFASYIVAAPMLEPQNELPWPRLSHGIQAGLISLPLCMILGAAIGIGIAFAIVRRHLISIVLLLLAGLGNWRVVNSMWDEQIRRYGRDPCEAVLYYPPLGFSILALVVALTVALIAVVRWRARAAQRSDARGPDGRGTPTPNGTESD